MIRVIRPGHDDVVTGDAVTWQPLETAEPLVIDVAALFREALG